jgi:hypothetical protein
LKVNLSLNCLSWPGPSNLGSKWVKNDLKMCSMASLDANDVMDSAFCRQNFTLYSKTKLVQSKKIWSVIAETVNFGSFENQLATFHFINSRKLCCCYFCRSSCSASVKSNMYDFMALLRNIWQYSLISCSFCFDVTLYCQLNFPFLLCASEVQHQKYILLQYIFIQSLI